MPEHVAPKPIPVPVPVAFAFVILATNIATVPRMAAREVAQVTQGVEEAGTGTDEHVCGNLIDKNDAETNPTPSGAITCKTQEKGFKAPAKATSSKLLPALQARPQAYR